MESAAALLKTAKSVTVVAPDAEPLWLFGEEIAHEMRVVGPKCLENSLEVGSSGSRSRAYGSGWA